MQKTFYLVLEELENRTGNLECSGLKGRLWCHIDLSVQLKHLNLI